MNSERRDSRLRPRRLRTGVGCDAGVAHRRTRKGDRCKWRCRPAAGGDDLRSWRHAGSGGNCVGGLSAAGGSWDQGEKLATRTQLAHDAYSKVMNLAQQWWQGIGLWKDEDHNEKLDWRVELLLTG